jgi:hypothetical protein
MTLYDEARRMAPSLSRGIAFVYILQLRSGAFYVGCSSDAETRFNDHLAGKAFARRPWISPSHFFLSNSTRPFERQDGENPK